jgi:hypothetical protein
LIPVQLANAILTERARDVDGLRPIPLAETRRANQVEYQSLVGAEPEEDGENVDETQSESSSFEEETRTEGISIMGNANARVSQLDLHSPSPRQQGGISEKAGVILVELPILLLRVSAADRCVTGDPQHICGDTAVSHDGFVVVHICDF